MMFIEVAVASFIDTDKADFIKQLGIKTIEIDLREIITQGIRLPSEEAKDHILDCVTNKQWIFPSPNLLSIPVARHHYLSLFIIARAVLMRIATEALIKAIRSIALPSTMLG